MLTLGLVVKEAVNLGGGTVVGADGETVISNVEDQVLAHNGQTDEAEISTGSKVRRSADINAGETGTIVSDRFQMSIAGKKANHQEIQRRGMYDPRESEEFESVSSIFSSVC